VPVWAFLLLLLMPLSGCSAQPNSRRSSMASSEFETNFQIVADGTGEAYRRARQRILDAGPAVAPLIEARRTASEWRSRLAAEVLSGWLSRKEVLERAGEYIQGNLPGEAPITGTFTPSQRAKMVEQLGGESVPRLLEMLISTPDELDGKAREAIFTALAALKDGRAVPGLLHVLETEQDPGTRVLAAATLGRTGETQAAAPLLRIVQTPSEPLALRAAAAIAVGELRAPDALALLTGMLQDPAADLALRKAAVQGLQRLEDRKANPALLRALERESDRELLILIVDTLASLGDASTLPALDRVAKGHSDRFVRESAEAARYNVAERSR
jgi:HEAT repeat protein